MCAIGGITMRPEFRPSLSHDKETCPTPGKDISAVWSDHSPLTNEPGQSAQESPQFQDCEGSTPPPGAKNWSLNV